jgi:UDP-N-acetylmuramoyl-L-alanyl-D-glutamate--2,6-diaminopimelate ligase
VNDTRQTTLEALEIQELLARMRDSGIRHAVIETSSHGLAMDRVVGCEYDIAVFTNIAHEHLDFHGTIADYRKVKASLIDMTAAAVDKGIPKSAVLNHDDASFAVLAARPITRRITYGAAKGADCKLLRMTPSINGLQVVCRVGAEQLDIQLRLAGRWNAHNALAAIAVGSALGLPLPQVKAGLEGVAIVTGRMERVDLGQPYQVIIDYAHTPQSLGKVLAELREITAGKLIAVFGSAGERDREKRQQMGAIAAGFSDYAVFTNEDPRHGASG